MQRDCFQTLPSYKDSPDKPERKVSYMNAISVIDNVYQPPV